MERELNKVRGNTFGWHQVQRKMRLLLKKLNMKAIIRME
jgi:hypothetical protein